MKPTGKKTETPTGETAIPAPPRDVVVTAPSPGPAAGVDRPVFVDFARMNRGEFSIIPIRESNVGTRRLFICSRVKSSGIRNLSGPIWCWLSRDLS